MVDPTHALVGESPGVVRARASLRALLDDPQPQPVLLIGEPGTGKELASRILHAGRVRPGHFRIVEADRDPVLVELDLFGHVVRSPDGWIKRDHAGALEGTGTLLIRDAERLPAELQVRLFRALERRHMQKPGQEAPRAFTPPRVVLACRPGADVAPIVHVLGWRVAPVELPPLRERREDLEALVAHLLRDERSRDGHPLRLRPAALAAFQRYDWPGNVDELARALRVLVGRHRATLRAERAHPVEAVHAAFGAALDRLFESVGEVAPPAPPTPPDPLGCGLAEALLRNDLDGLFRGLQRVAERVDARSASIWRVDEQGGVRSVAVACGSGRDPDDVTPIHIRSPEPGEPPVEQPRPGGTWRDHVRTWLTRDLGPAERELLALDASRTAPPRTLLSAPVRLGGRVVALLCAEDRLGKRDFSGRELVALEAVVQALGDALAGANATRLPELRLPEPVPDVVRDEPPPRVPEGSLAWAEPPVGWGPLPDAPEPLRAPRFTREGLAAAVSAAVTFSALMLGVLGAL